MPKGVYSTNGQQNRPKRYPVEMVTLVRSLYESGATQAEIATRLSIRQKIVWRLMKNHGIVARKAVIRNQTGSRNASWKGSEAGYQAKHLRVATTRGKPKHCADCGTTSKLKRYEWASLSKNYDDPNDYVRLCISCHRRRDGAVKNLRSDHA
jgi:hypothetical protein